MNSGISVSDVQNFVQGNIKYITKGSLPKYQLEQIELRKYMCSSCNNSTHCLHCGCKSPNLFYAPGKVDAQGKWGPFLSEIQWEILKDNIDKYAEYFKILRDVHEESVAAPTDSEDAN